MGRGCVGIPTHMLWGTGNIWNVWVFMWGKDIQNSNHPVRHIHTYKFNLRKHAHRFYQLIYSNQSQEVGSMFIPPPLFSRVGMPSNDTAVFLT